MPHLQTPFCSVVTLWFLEVVVKTETLIFDGTVTAPSIIECEDALTPCLINCTAHSACRDREIHCHRTAQQPCTIHMSIPTTSSSAGMDSVYYTHQAPIVHITALGWYAMFRSHIYAHEALGSKLYLSSDGPRALESSVFYAPVGEGSLLSINCKRGDGCRAMKIYDDWTTEVHIEAVEGARWTQVRNIFDDSPLNISRNDSNYIGLNSAYRAPVFLTAMDIRVGNTFFDLQYLGHNHGNWTLHGNAAHSFQHAYIEATADIPPYGGASGYDIKLIGTSVIDKGNDSLTGESIFAFLTLNASQFGANIYAEVTDQYGLSGAAIHAKNANSVQIYCKGGGDCDGLMVECPQNICMISCDDDAETDCSNMKIYTCSHVDVLCDGVDCNFGVGTSTVTKTYCGFDQNETYYQMQYNASGHVLCQNYGSGYCGPTSHPTKIPSTDPTIPFRTTDIGVTSTLVDTVIDAFTTRSAVFNGNSNRGIQESSWLVILLVIICGVVVLICLVLGMGYNLYRRNTKQQVMDDVANMRTLSTSQDIHKTDSLPQNTPHAPVIPVMSTSEHKSTRNPHSAHDTPERVRYHPEGQVEICSEGNVELQNDLDIIAGVNTLGANTVYNDGCLEDDEELIAGNTLGEGDAFDPPPPPSQVNAMEFVCVASEDEIIMGEDETDIGGTIQ
eukprot:924720_1